MFLFQVKVPSYGPRLTSRSAYVLDRWRLHVWNWEEALIEQAIRQQKVCAVSDLEAWQEGIYVLMQFSYKTL